MEIIFDKNHITFVGANGIRPPMIQINFPVYGTMALVAVRSFISSGFNINLPLTPGFESGFSGFRGLHRTSSVWVYGLFVTHRLFGGAIFKVYNFTLRP